MKAVRIYAVGVEDDKHKVVVISQIDESGFLNKEIESFGTITHYEMAQDSFFMEITVMMLSRQIFIRSHCLQEKSSRCFMITKIQKPMNQF